jgi:hypothetical protein
MYKCVNFIYFVHRKIKNCSTELSTQNLEHIYFYFFNPFSIYLYLIQSVI